MNHGFLMPVEAGEGFGLLGRFPYIYSVVLAGCGESFNYLVVDGCGLFEAFFGLCDLAFFRGGNFACVVVIGGSEDEVCGKSEMVDPVSVGGERLY